MSADKTYEMIWDCAACSQKRVGGSALACDALACDALACDALACDALQTLP